MTLRAAGQNGSWIVNLPRVEALQPYWNYRWGLERVDAQSADVEFLPMVWGGAAGAEGLAEKLQTTVVPHIQSGLVQRVMGFNEPDKATQSNLSVERALELWPQLEALGVPLVSPSCARAHGQWMQEFMERASAECRRVDWIGVHWYGGIRPARFQARLEQIYQQYGKPILVTEFAPTDRTALAVSENRHSRQEVLDFAKVVLPWMEAQDWIAGYAWFPFDIDRAHGWTSALFDEDGQMTALGRYYASVTTENPSGDQSIQVEKATKKEEEEQETKEANFSYKQKRIKLFIEDA